MEVSRRQLARILSGGVVVDFLTPDENADALVSGTSELVLDVPGVPPLIGGAGK